MDKIEQLARELLKEIEKTDVVKEAHSRQYVPEKGDQYFCICAHGLVQRNRWFNDHSDKRRLAMGNVYRTEEEAQKVVDRKKLIQDLWQEDGVFLDPDWGDENQAKYCLDYDYYLGKWSDYCVQCVQIQFELPHFKSDQFVQDVIEKYGSRLDVLL